MKRSIFSLVALAPLALACDAGNPAGPADDGRLVNPQFASGGIIHRVSVGSHDFVPPGVDANFSLVAIQHADGRVTGQWSDQFGHGNNGVHVAIDCVHVVGNRAWLGGVATDKTFEGLRVITLVEDNGTSAHETPDQISFTVIDPAQFGISPNCNDAAALPLFPLSGGEVKVD